MDLPPTPLPDAEPSGAAGRSPRPVGLPAIPLSALAEIVSTHSDPRGPVPGVGVTGVTLRSGDVRPGDLFVALAGSAAHGATFATDAVRAGAVAILTDEVGRGILHRQSGVAHVPVLVAPAPRAVLGAIAAAIYHHPSADLRVVGVTGTSGKTTTSFLLEGALAAAGYTVGVIGTVGARIGGEPLPSALTTPEAPDLQALFAVMRQRGVNVVAIEVSSHALALGRVDGTRFDVGAFTNLSQDHLDFHGDMDQYFAAKKLLFDGRARAEVVVIDDEYGRRLAAERPGAMTVTGERDRHADWRYRVSPGGQGRQRLAISGPEGLVLSAEIALPGSFNATNAVTALACVAAVGIDPAVAAPGLADVQVPGRLQRIDAGQPFLALVDYAHKPAAVRAVLAAVREHSRGRVIIVIGAGGDRDHGKRSLMGAEAARGADLVIVTDDNPRSEDPATIREAVLTGAREVVSGGAASDAIARRRVEVREIGDRRSAIGAAVAAAGPGDVVVIAGKGHELGQDVGGVVHHFSDVEELTAALVACAESEGVPGDSHDPR